MTKFIYPALFLTSLFLSLFNSQDCRAKNIYDQILQKDAINKEILDNIRLADSAYVYTPKGNNDWAISDKLLYFWNITGTIDSIYFRSIDNPYYPFIEKDLYKYDNHGQLIQKATYKGEYLGWQIQDRLTLFYNNEYQLERQIYEVHDTSWIENFYYTDRLLVKRDKIIPASVDSNIYHNIIEYHYNDRKLLSDSVTYSLKGTKLFYDMRKFSFKYDDYDSLTSVIITVSKDGNKWYNNDKTDITYNSMGKVSQVYDYIWIDTIPGWLNLDRTTYYYNENKLLDSIYGLEWDNQQWVDSFRDYTTYIDGNKISCNWRKYTKTGNSNLWYNNNKTCYTSYPDSSVTIYQEGEYYIYDDIWFNRVKVVNYFGRNSSVYHDILDNTIPEGETVDIFVYDLPGRLVWHDSLPYSVKMRIEDILTNVGSGCYFALIKSKNVTLNKKVLVIH